MQRWSLHITLMILSSFFSTAMAADFGHVTVADPILGLRDIVYEKKEGYAVVESDILLEKLSTSSEKNAHVPRALILSKLGGDRWPEGVIPFEIDSHLPLANKIAALEAMEVWQKNTQVKFVELNPSNRNQYQDYLLFTPIEGTTCASYVGKQNGAQVVKLSPRCQTMNTAHEIGHALGLWHEQSRADRDQYIQIVWENIDEKYIYNFNQHLSDGQDFGDYDYQSIMHYTDHAFSKNGERTIIPLHEDVEIGQRDHLSSKDIAAVNAMYP
ncbi:M12 family metallopeptidase [bacterium]|nr:M12 family metallopeptidase [bacterium]